MNIIDWIAILGALAWTPHLFSFIHNFLTKPVIQIITPRTVSLGFTTLGSIFNLNLAFSVRNKDIVISSIAINLKHESGEEKVFNWQNIQQQIMKMRIPDGSVLPYEKEQSVLAIKINEKDIEERFIQFQESSFHIVKNAREDKLAKDITYQRKQNKYDPKTFIESQDALEFFDIIKQAFSWKAGKYKVVINIKSPDAFTIKDNEYEFLLTAVDVDFLEHNKEYIKLDYKNYMVPQKEEDIEKVNWNWRNPELKKLNK